MKLNIQKSFANLATASLALVVSTKAAFAQITNPVVGDFGNNIKEAESGSLFVRYFVQLWNVAISIGAIILIIMFLWGSFEWITAGSDTGKVQSAQKRLMYAALGLFLLIASFAIIEFVSLIFFDGEFSILNLTLPTPGE